MGVMAKTSLLGVCVIGAGRAGMIHARNFSFGRVTQAALAAIVEPSEPARQAARQELRLEQVYVDYRQALADPSVAAVVVATPSEHHCEIVVAAARAGKHILCEKPMAMNVRECDEMLAAVDRAGVKFQIGFMRRFDAGFVAARRQIEAGEIGRVVLVKSLTYGPSIPKPWMYDIRESNGPLSEVNSHDIDTLRWFSSSEFEEVYTIAGNYRSPDAVEMYPDFYDNVVLSARMRNGTQGSICGRRVSVTVTTRAAEILGEKGLITVGSLAAAAVTTHNAAGSTTPIVRSWTDLFLDAYRIEDEDFVRCVLENCTPRVGGVDGKAAVAVVNAGNRSIRERRPVRIDEEGVSLP